MPGHAGIHAFDWGTKEGVDAGLRRHDAVGTADEPIIRTPGMTYEGRQPFFKRACGLLLSVNA